MSKPVSEWLPTEPSSPCDGDVDTFVREHQTELLSFFRGRGAQPHDAADLAQESWSRLIRYRDVKERASLRGLLFTIARNVLHNHWRWSGLRQIEQPTDFSGFDVASELPSLERQWQAQQGLQRLEAAVAQLPDKCRTVFLLSRIEGLSNAKVAQRCGISVKMVEKHLAKAIVQCRALVGDIGP